MKRVLLAIAAVVSLAAQAQRPIWTGPVRCVSWEHMPRGYTFHDPATIQVRVLDVANSEPIIGADVVVANGYIGRATTKAAIVDGHECPRCSASAEVNIPVNWYWENALCDAAGPYTQLDLWAYKQGYLGVPNYGGMTQETIIVRPGVISRRTLLLQVKP